MVPSCLPLTARFSFVLSYSIARGSEASLTFLAMNVTSAAPRGLFPSSVALSHPGWLPVRPLSRAPLVVRSEGDRRPVFSVPSEVSLSYANHLPGALPITCLTTRAELNRRMAPP